MMTTTAPTTSVVDDSLFTTFKYNFNDDSCKRQQSLRNAYIHYGFTELKKKLRSIATSPSIENDLAFLEKEESRLT